MSQPLHLGHLIEIRNPVHTPRFATFEAFDQITGKFYLTCQLERLREASV